jgi:hypothetical protein
MDLDPWTDHRSPHPARFELWRKVWRSEREFEEGIPILWPNFLGVQLQISRLLSPASNNHVFTFYFGTVEFHVNKSMN